MMPIRPENRARYPKNWKEIVEKIRKRSKNRCEFYYDEFDNLFPKGKRGLKRCKALNHEMNPTTGSMVVLTVAHLNHVPEDCAPTNLRHACQRCHNRYDAPMRRAGIKKRAREKLACGDLLEAVHASA